MPPPPHVVPRDEQKVLVEYIVENKRQEEAKAVASVSAHPEHPTHRIFKVYVTGFGAFRGTTVNPSYLIASSLPPVLDEKYVRYGDVAPDANLQVSIIPHPEAVTVAYSNIESLIPEIHKDFPGVDLFVHIGVAPIEGYQIETRARKGPYDGLDVEGKRPESHFADKAGDGKVPEDVIELDSSIDLVGIHDYLGIVKKRDETEPFLPPNLSRDAGLYLCEYILYSSMAEAIYVDEHLSEAIPAERPTIAAGTPPSTARAIFIHVTPAFDDKTIAQGRETVMRIIGAIAAQRASGATTSRDTE